MKAAASLNVSQPAVTKTIRELEAELGVAVLERDGRGIRVTSHGEVFLRHAGAALSAMRQGIDSVSASSLGSAPPIRIGALPTVSSRIMPRAMEIYLSANAVARTKIVTGENSVLLDQLRLGDLDIVVGRLAAPEQMTGFSFEHLYSEQVKLVVRPAHPLLNLGAAALAQLDRYTLLMPTTSSIIRPFVDRFLIANGMPEPVRQIETVSDSFGRAFVKATDAVWIISEGVVAADISEGSLAALAVDTSETRGSVGLTVRASAPPPPSLDILMETIRQAAREMAR